MSQSSPITDKSTFMVIPGPSPKESAMRVIDHRSGDMLTVLLADATMLTWLRATLGRRVSSINDPELTLRCPDMRHHNVVITVGSAPMGETVLHLTDTTRHVVAPFSTSDKLVNFLDMLDWAIAQRRDTISTSIDVVDISDLDDPRQVLAFDDGDVVIGRHDARFVIVNDSGDSVVVVLDPMARHRLAGDLNRVITSGHDLPYRGGPHGIVNGKPVIRTIFHHDADNIDDDVPPVIQVQWFDQHHRPVARLDLPRDDVVVEPARLLIGALLDVDTKQHRGGR